ncbi:MAG: GIY-YIG nuclease family protein [Chloroflexota bacterium]
MFWRKGNACAYWDCKKSIPDDEVLCLDHYHAWTNGAIDRCPKCGRFKDKTNRLCLDCHFGLPVNPRKPPDNIPPPKQVPEVKYKKLQLEEYTRPGRFYVYILEFGREEFYIGHANNMGELRRRFSRHKKLRTIDAAVQVKPRLQYLEIVPTERAAELRDAELKELLKTDPGQVHRMIDDFYREMRELDIKEYFE